MSNPAKELTARFKSLRVGLKKWSKNLSKLNKIIEACSYVLAILDGLEEQRNLSIQENNFRNALKKHQLKLLEAKRIYWKSRAKIKWAQLGNENTKFFDTVATQNFRGNFIATLKTNDDRLITDHGAKRLLFGIHLKTE